MTRKAAFCLFDLDGTLSNPVIGIGRCLNHALRHHGHSPVAESEVPRFIGPPLDETFGFLVPSATPGHVAALVWRYRERYAEIGYAENVLYPGIPEALETLHAAGVPLGLCTSKRADFAERILDLFGIRHYFRFVSGGDIGIRKADQLAALIANGVIDSSSTMIGDRATDILAAKANALRSVAVLWGHGSLAELQDASPDAMVATPRELAKLAVV